MKNILIIICLSVIRTFAQNPEKLDIQTLDSLFQLHLSEGQMNKAAPFAEESLKKSKKSDLKQQSNSLNNIALLYKNLARYEESEKYYLQSLEIKKKLLGEKHADYATGLNNLAALYFYMSRFEEAESLLLKTLSIRKETLGSSDPQYARSLNNLSELYRNLERYAEAGKLAAEALDIYRKSKEESRFKEAICLSNIASICFHTERFEEADSLYLLSMDLMRREGMKEHPAYTQNLNDLALLYRKTKRNPEAITLLKEVLALDKKQFGEIHPYYAGSLHNLAAAYRHMERYAEAEPLYIKALDIWEKTIGKQNSDYITGMNNLAKLYLYWGRYTESEASIQKAILLNCKTAGQNIFKNPSDIAKQDFLYHLTISESLEIYSQFFLKTNKTDSAYQIMRVAISLNEKLRHSFALDDDKFRSLSKMNDLLKTTFKTGSLQKDENIRKELFGYAELNKSILLADATKAQKARALSDIPDSLILKELKLQENLDGLKKKELESKSETERLAVNKEINELNRDIDGFKKMLETRFPKYFQLKYATKTTFVEDIQKGLNEKTIFLEYFISDSTVYLFVIGKQNFQLLTLAIEEKQLAAGIKNLRKALCDYDFIKNKEDEAYKLYTASAHWFYENLLMTALSTNKHANQLIIVADGELGHLPFEAFLTEEISQKLSYSALPYLLNKYKISYNYSATLWKESVERPQNKSNSKMLAIAASYKSEADNNSVRRSGHLRNLRDALQDLPAAKQEVEALSKLFTGAFWQENSSNEHNFKENAGEYGIIHLAMHGLLNQRAPILSSMAFTENGDSTEDNFLEAWEISHMKLNANLVVLSACETGYGKFQQGEGIMSLARSFMYAGVPSLVVSLWQVNDAATSEIMQLFYKNLANGMDKAEALQEAKLEYIKTAGKINPMASHPAFWAAFVQIGDSRPIKIAQKGNSFIGILLGSMALLILTFGIIALVNNAKAERNY